ESAGSDWRCGLVGRPGPAPLVGYGGKDRRCHQGGPSMSGFSPEWLALREPADMRARDPGLLAALAAHLAGRDAIEVVDLGCGAGSNIRTTAPALGPVQSWTLVDYDPVLLEAARAALMAWADEA